MKRMDRHTDGLADNVKTVYPHPPTTTTIVCRGCGVEG